MLDKMHQDPFEHTRALEQMILLLPVEDESFESLRS